MANNQKLASPSASATPNGNYNYEVFLNHRGPDVKKTFASHLYRRLLSYGFRVFLDQQEMQVGDDLTCQIKGAIETASVHVAIFSPRYAESKWCLDELLLMLKSGATIIPVFYRVNPSELRRTQDEGNCGKYAKALRQLEKKKRCEPETVEKWRQALSSVADISGLELQECNGDEGELVDRVLHLVQKSVRKPLLEVATDQPWLEEKLQDFERTVLSQHHSEEVKIVGIAGVGGVGKTTLAKLFFNGKRSEYDRSCFLFDVREAASRGSLTSLQSKLYEDLTGRAQIVNSIDEGIAMLKSHVPSSQVLVILDDVDSVEQLRALFSPLKDTLISCSLILITSSDNALLKSCDMKNSSIYNLKGLNREDSRKLFCLQAFRQHNPVVGFEEVVSQFLDQCQGLPLSLKVIGALLYTVGQDLGYWRDQLQKISEVVPKDIRGRLKISVDSLDEQEREIFLDIACFFIGENREKAIKIWDASNWRGSLGFQNLENKYLVEVDHRNRIRMHSHLRDLGRALAVKEPKVRLWRLTDNAFCNVSHQSSVRGINLQTSGIALENLLEIGNPFVDLRGLQLLRVQGEWCEGISNHLRWSNLLWLRWDFSSVNRISSHVSEGVSESVSFSHGFSESVSEIASSSRLGSSEVVVSSDRPCRYFSLPSSIPIKNLRVLEIFGGESHLETLWESGSEVPIQLRELNIDVAHLQLPKSIGMLKHLEKIELGYAIEALPEEFFLLRSLKHLRMRVSMKLLPNAIGNLSSLGHLNLTGSCDLERLPNSFGDLTNLQYLSLYGCSRLETLPESFGSLIRLKHLSLKGCSKLTLSTETLGNIRTLESLDLSDCQKVEVLPPQVTRQWSLEKLSLWNANLKELPGDIGNLSNLAILRVSFQESSMAMLPPSLGKLKSLKHLTLFGGIWKCLPASVAELKQLTDLKIDCGRIEYLPASSRQLKSLTILKVTRCPLREVPFGRVENFEVEDASPHQSERRLLDSSIHKGMLLRLEQLDLHGTRIKELSFAEGVCPNLRQLYISDCLELEEVGALPTTLILLDLNGCDALKKITGFCGLAKLKELDLRKCEAVEELPGVETLISLVHLRVSGCFSLKSIRGLAQATNLRIPATEAPHSDLIEWELFKDLKSWKEELHELQVKGKDFRRANQEQSANFMWVNKPPADTEGLARPANALRSEAEDHARRANALQSEAEAICRSANALRSEAEDHDRRANALRLVAEDHDRRANALLSEIEAIGRRSNALLLAAVEFNGWANILRSEAEAIDRRANALRSDAEHHDRRANALRSDAEHHDRRAEALRSEIEAIGRRANALPLAAVEFSRREPWTPEENQIPTHRITRKKWSSIGWSAGGHQKQNTGQERRVINLSITRPQKQNTGQAGRMLKLRINGTAAEEKVGDRSQSATSKAQIATDDVDVDSASAN